MAGSDITHASLLDAYPGAESAECDGHGFVDVTYATDSGRSGHGRCAACEAQKLRGAIGNFVPPRFRLPVEVPGAVATWAGRGPEAEGLYLTGPVGTGKTHAAWTAVSLWCAATSTLPRGESHESPHGLRGSPTVIFTRMTDLLDDMRPGDEARQRVRDCQNAALLVLDDVGAEKASEWTQERLYTIIDHRYVHCRPLIVTSNLPPLALAEQAGKRTASRLAQMCAVVPMTGGDRRKPAA